MYKNIKLLLPVALVVYNLLFFGASAVKAAPIVAGVLSIDYPGSPGPLFNATNIFPGYEDTKSLVVTNNGKVPHSFSIAVSGELGSLADVIIIEPKVLNSVVWSKTISQIAKNPESNIIIGSIAPSGAATVQLRAYLPVEVGNDYQGKTTLSFSFMMGNENTDALEPADNTGQIGSGVSTVAATGFSRLFTRNTVPIEESTNGVANNLNGEVKGIQTEDDSDGKAQGEETSEKPVCFWWWLLSIIFALFLVIYGYIVKKREVILAWLWPLFGGGIFYLIHWILHDYFTPSKWCPYFVLIELALLALYYALVNRISNRAEEE